MAQAIQHRQISVTLELDEAEAQVLRDICDMIGGLPSTRRGLVNQIKNALCDAGIYASEKEDVDCSANKIYFI